jgi:hypothetical protein
MSFSLPQTSFNLYPANSVLGQLYKTAQSTENINTYPAVALVKAGDLLEKLYDATSLSYVVRAAQSAHGALLALAGVAIYKSAKGGAPASWAGLSTPSDYQVGELVPFCRRGSVFAKWLSKDGATGQSSFTSPNYAHSSTVSASSATNGAFTDITVTATGGSEVDACPTGVLLREDQTGVTPNGSGLGQAPGFGTCLVELNLP